MDLDGFENRATPSKGEMQDYYLDHMYRDDMQIPPDEVVLRYNGVDIGNRGNILVITGRAKSRKSVVASAMMSALQKGRFLGFERAADKPPKILHVDTEQGIGHYIKSVRRVLKDAGLNNRPNNYTSLWCRDAEIDFRRDFIQFSLEQNEPDVLVIDGVTDMIFDINSQEEAQRLGQLLMTWSTQFKCLVIVVIHVTKSNNNMTGAIGTVLEKKCQTAIGVRKEEDDETISTVGCLYSRDEGFPQFAITFDKALDQYIALDPLVGGPLGPKADHSPDNYVQADRDKFINDVFRSTSHYLNEERFRIALRDKSFGSLGDKINATEAAKWFRFWNAEAAIVQHPDYTIHRNDRKLIALQKTQAPIDYSEAQATAQDEDLAQYIKEYPENNIGNNPADDLPF